MGMATRITTLTSREFNQDLGRAKRAAKQGPVFVTDRGKPAHVLLSYEDYEQLSGKGKGKSIIDLLAMSPGVEDIELDLPERRDYPRPIDLD